MKKDFLPVSKEDLIKRGWDGLDIILVTGDAYVDHPSYAASVIGRVLEDGGFRVGVIAQPDRNSLEDFSKLGRPRLFFGVTAGNVDSLVANYTANKKIRTDDDYSPGGRPAFRPDRAVIVYTNKLKEAFKDVPIVLGGLEASLRRLAHYDYWSDKVRRSVLLDAKADILVYGMGERQVLEIARRLRSGEKIKELAGIRGTVIVRNDIGGLKDYVAIPSFEEVSQDKNKFNEAFKRIYRESDPHSGKTVAQRHGDRFLIQFPPPLPMTTEELDRIYLLDYVHDWHPMYDNPGGVPGFETARYSITSNRGCCGECSFCSLSLHQGRIVQSRSLQSIIKEAERMAAQEDFRGTITDIGGPTANLYTAACDKWKKDGACRSRSCLTPEKCGNLKIDHAKALRLFEALKRIPKVRHVFIGSGVRYDLLTDKDSEPYLKTLCRYHVSGRLKVAPEHAVDSVLNLMNKPRVSLYERFAEKYTAVNRSLGKDQYLVNYFITGHPGSRLEDALAAALYLAKRKIHPEQAQDYLPLPMTRSGCMYYTGKDPFTGRDVYVARRPHERKLHRALLQYKQPGNKRYVMEALTILKRRDLIKVFYPFRRRDKTVTSRARRTS